jgi:hypothetical protein
MRAEPLFDTPRQFIAPHHFAAASSKKHCQYRPRGAHRRVLRLRPMLLTLIAVACVACEAGSNGEAPNQGALQQTAAGQIVANLSSRGIEKDPRFTELSMIALYLYKKTDYSLSCTAAADRRVCEDGLIFRNEKVDSLGFTNEPGYFGYEPSYDPPRYYPNLVAADGYNYPQTKPADPPGFADPDVWQCLYSGFQGGYACGVNSHPIRHFNKQLTTYTLQVYATNGQGYASSYILDYNLFNSLNHPVKDGDRYYAYFAVHFNAMKAAANSEDRFDANASTWKRPIEPDLVSPRIEVKVKLLPEGPYDRAGSVYDIPDYSTWYDPLAGCRAAQSVPANSVYISEIMWMGSKSVAGAGALEDEFIEIYNSNAFDVSISRWKILGAGTSSEAIVLPTCAVIKAGGVYTVGAQSTKAFTKLDHTNAKFSLSNSGESTFGLTDANSTPVYSHTISNCTTGPWGGFGVNGNAGVPKRSMRLVSRNTHSTTCASGWTSTSTADTGYSAGSANLSSNYSGSADTGVEGTIATPGFAGPL